MVVAEVMKKPVVKISVSDSDSSSEESEESTDKVEIETDLNATVEGDAGSESSNEEGETANDDDASSNEEDVSSNDEGAPSDDEGASSNDERESSNDGNTSENEQLVTNEGWADSVAKILGSSKPKNKKTLVLSRAKKHSEIVKKEVEEKPAFEVIGESGDAKSEVKKELVKKEVAEAEPPVKKRKHEKAPIRVKPNILEKDREKLLNKIATKGVVQLFNAVRNQQKTLEKEIGRSDLSEGKKKKILKKFDKRSFLDTLMGPTKSVVVDEVKPLKDEVRAEEKPRWSALRDDFMMGAKMKDWDKEVEDE